MSSFDMYVNGEYLKNNPTWGVEDAAWKSDLIQQLMTSNHLHPNEIIEVGCGAGAILDDLSQKNKNISSFKGYDISPQAIAMARTKATPQLQFFQEDITVNDQLYTDVMLVIDVVEHIPDLYGFLQKIRTKSKHFIFHIPLDLSCRTILKPHVLLQQREAVGHIHYFSKEMVLWFLSDAGYEIVDWIYTKPMIDQQPAGSFKNAVKKMLRNISFSLNKNLSVKLWGGYSMMILTK